MGVLAPDEAEQLTRATMRQVDIIATGGHHPVCLCSPNVRLALRRLMEPSLPQLTVVSYNEIRRDVEVISTGMVEMQHDSEVVHS